MRKARDKKKQGMRKSKAWKKTRDGKIKGTLRRGRTTKKSRAGRNQRQTRIKDRQG